MQYLRITVTSSHMKNTFWLYILIGLVSFSTTALGQNKKDAQGRKQGPWVRKYKNGNFKYKGQFKDDKPIGDFIYYDTKLNITARVTYNEDGTADAKLYHSNKKVAGAGKYINKKKEGIWKFYSTYGYLSSEEEFKRGERNGIFKVYYKNGQLSRETTFVNGLENGLRTDFFDNGNKSFKGNILDGNFDGLVEFYHDNGKIQMKGTYKDAVRHGKWTWYSERGLPIKVVRYDLGKITETIYEKKEQ